MNKNGDTKGKGDKPQEQSPMAFMYSYAEKCKVRMDYLCWFTKGNVSLKFQISYVDACIYFILCFVWVGVFLGCCFESSSMVWRITRFRTNWSNHIGIDD